MLKHAFSVFKVFLFDINTTYHEKPNLITEFGAISIIYRFQKYQKYSFQFDLSLVSPFVRWLGHIVEMVLITQKKAEVVLISVYRQREKTK